MDTRTKAIFLLTIVMSALLVLAISEAITNQSKTPAQPVSNNTPVKVVSDKGHYMVEWKDSSNEGISRLTKITIPEDNVTCYITYDKDSISCMEGI
jgi:hypothetical protein